MLTREDIKQLKSVLTTKDDLHKLATKEELKKLATKDELESLNSKVEKLASKTDQLASKTDLKKLEEKVDKGFKDLNEKADGILKFVDVVEEEHSKLEKRVKRIEAVTTTS